MISFRHARSPQRVHPRAAKRKKTPSFCTSTNRKNRKNTSSFCTLTTPIPAEGRAGRSEIAKNLEFLHITSTTPIPAEGRAGRSEIAKNLEFLHLGHADVANPIDDQSPAPAPYRKLNLTYIAANAEALCTWLYALGSMRLALYTWLYTRLYALGSVHLAPCTWLHVLGSMRSALCTRLCALGSALCALGSTCTWLYALGSMHLAPCTWRIGLCASDSMQVGPRAPRGRTLHGAFGKSWHS